LSVSHDPQDPENQAALARAVKLVLQQVKDGGAPPQGFVSDGLQTVAALLTSNPALESSEMTESVLKLVELVAMSPRSEQDWVAITELLVSCAAQLEPMRHRKYIHLVTLACLTTQREVSALGKASLGRLVYFCHQLGQALEISQPLPECIGSVGGCFHLLYDNLAGFADPALALRLKEMVTLWRNLPPTMPAAASVSRQLLTALARSL